MATATFGQQALSIHQLIQSSGVPLHDMRSAVSLEDRLGELQQLDEPAPHEDRGSGIEWLESPDPFARPVAESAAPLSIRYFLDGSQRTLPGYHHAAIPLLASVTVAAILERRSPVDLRVDSALLRFNSAWLVPERASSNVVQRFVDAVRDLGIDIVDPLDHLTNDETYVAALDDFIGLEQAAMAASRRLRRQAETALLRAWTNDPSADGSWLVVDGALREPAPQTIGLVKSFSRQYIGGDFAEELFRLPAAHRSPVFRVADRRHGGSYAVWYLRFWDASGRDPRYGLVRLEVAFHGEPPPVDSLSASVLAERRPRASHDSRWPTLIYPIHYLEQILKNYLAREIRLWPGARSAA